MASVHGASDETMRMRGPESMRDAKAPICQSSETGEGSMSLWQCPNHGLVGPDSCCAHASRATVTTPNESYVFDWRFVAPPKPPAPPKFTKRELEWLRSRLKREFDDKPGAIGRAYALSIIGKIEKSIPAKRPFEVPR